MKKTMRWLVFIAIVTLTLGTGVVGLHAQEHALGDLGIPPDYAQTIRDFKQAMPKYDAFVDQLPTAFNWKTLGKVTTAKNQGSCGGCWSFAATGAFESKLLINSMPTYDLSEQQQISCNTSMSGCSGGSMSSLRYWETTGPMLESCTGYPSSGGSVPACSTLSGCSKLTYRTLDYYTVNMANRDEIKTSLYTDGPTYFRFNVYTDFDTFWNTGTSGQVYKNTGGTNRGGHAVLLIGWSDSKGAWLLKNSWGATAGPNGDGTFWMAYTGHTIDLGFGMANTHVNVTTPQAISPNGTVSDTTPTYTWTKAPGATQYHIQVYKGATLVINQYVASTACGTTYCSATPTTALSLYATYNWKAQALTTAGWSAYGASLNFIVRPSVSGFIEPFSWFPVYGSWSMSSGYYQNSGAANLSTSAANGGTYANLDYEVKMKRTGCSSCANRIKIRGTTTPLDSSKWWNKGYYFQYSNDGSFSVWKTNAGVSTAIKGWTATPYIISDGWNTLRVVANGSSMKYYLNGHLLWSGTDTALTSGMVGMGLYRDSSSTGNLFQADSAILSTIVTSDTADMKETVEKSGEEYTGWSNPNQSPQK
jgi:hypothetical protein